jgi:hypothetical protein
MSIERRYPLLKHNHEVADLRDVDIAAIEDGETLVWDEAQQKFVPGVATGGGGTDVDAVLTTNGDLLTRAAGALARLGIGSEAQVLTVASGAPVWATLAGGSGNADVQVFTADDTWEKPPGAQLVYAYCVGGGGGGGSGRASISGNAAGGGGGGGAGRSEAFFATSGLPDTVAVTVGAPGAGGAARAGNTDTNGAGGGDGGSSRFGALVAATGGQGGGGGLTGSGSAGTIGRGSITDGLAGGSGQNTSGQGANNTAGTDPRFACGGGGGGGGATTTANVARPGGRASDIQFDIYDDTMNVDGAAGLTGATGTAGVANTQHFVGGGGGGGGNGTSGSGVSAGAGGAGGAPGGGGAGGGGYCGNNPANASGAGGSGGSGVVVVVTFFDGSAGGGTTSGTFTATLTGVVGTVTTTIRYTRVGSLVFLHCDQLTGTSNSTACTITGLPVDLWPARLQRVTMDSVFDNSNYIGQPTMLRVETTGVLTLDITTVVGSGLFSASGTKGVNYGFAVTYSLD